MDEQEDAKQFQCSVCRDSGWLFLEKPLRRCDCRLQKIRAARFQKAVELTPRKFREQYGVRNGLLSLQTDAPAKEKQTEILRLLEKNSEKSFYFYGKTGTRKTTFAWALLQEAGRRGQKVGGDTGRTLADTLRNYALRQTLPTQNNSFYSLAQLKEPNERFCVLIDEIELFPVTDYSLSTLFELVDTVQSYEQQLIITSNKSLKELFNKWEQTDRDGKANAVDYCEKLSRRLREVCAMVEINGARAARVNVK